MRVETPRGWTSDLYVEFCDIEGAMRERGLGRRTVTTLEGSRGRPGGGWRPFGWYIRVPDDYYLVGVAVAGIATTW